MDHTWLCSGLTPGLYSGVTPRDVQGTVWGARDWTGIADCKAGALPLFLSLWPIEVFKHLKKLIFVHFCKKHNTAVIHLTDWGSNILFLGPTWCCSGPYSSLSGIASGVAGVIWNWTCTSPRGWLYFYCCLGLPPWSPACSFFSGRLDWLAL